MMSDFSLRLKTICEFINAPGRIESIEHMQQLIAEANCLKLIEKSFFQEVEVIINE